SFSCGVVGRTTCYRNTVYFSENTTNNHLSENTCMAFIKYMKKSAKKKPYQYMSDEDAQLIVKPILPIASDSMANLLKSDRPNVVLILLEGMVAQVFEELAGEKGITPRSEERRVGMQCICC